MTCFQSCRRPHDRRLAVGRRLLAAAILDPEVLPILAYLDLDCLVDPRQRAVLAAIRALEAAGEQIGTLAIDDWLLARDAERGSRLAELAGASYLGQLLADCEPYCAVGGLSRASCGQIALDVGELRCALRLERKVVAAEEGWYGVGR